MTILKNRRYPSSTVGGEKHTEVYYYFLIENINHPPYVHINSQSLFSCAYPQLWFNPSSNAALTCPSVSPSVPSSPLQCLCCFSSLAGFNLIMSSILRMEMAASVANLKLLIFDIAGSTTPAVRLSRTTPFVRSNPL